MQGGDRVHCIIAYERGNKESKNPSNKGKPNVIATKNPSSAILTIVVLPLWEALPVVLLPLSVGIVGTDISRGDNEGTWCGTKGGGWSTKKHEM